MSVLLAAATLSYIIGFFLSDLFMWSLRTVIIMATALVLMPYSLCAATWAAHKRNVIILAVIPSFLFLGALVTHIKTDASMRDAFAFEGKDVTISGTVISVPKFYDENTVYILRARRINCDNSDKEINEKIKISSELKVSAGDSVSVTGKLKQIAAPKNSTSFNSRRYNQRSGIFFSLFAEECNAFDEEYSLSIIDRFSLFSSSLTDNFINRFDSENAPLLKGIIMNNKSEIPDTELENMLQSGTYRYIYCPYLHIALLISIVSALFKERRSKTIALICVFFLYLCLNMTLPSAWKLCLFFAISHIITYKYGLNDITSSLLLTVLLTGIISPQILSEPSFILSASCTVLIRGFKKPFAKLLFRILHHRKIASVVSVYILIVIGLIPLLSYLGFGLTPYSFIFGFVLMPLTSLVYILFALSAVISLMTGIFFDFGIPIILSTIRAIAQFAAGLPLASVSLGKCGLLFPAAFYSVLLFIYQRINFKRTARAVGMICAAICLAFSVSFIGGINDAELIFINVGQGDCTLFRTPDNKTVMIDGGGSGVYSDYSIGEAEVLPFLETYGIKEIDYAIVSHYHKDHVDGMITVIQNLKVGEIFIPDYLPNSKYRDIIEQEASTSGTRITLVKDRLSANLSDKLKAEFYSTRLGSPEDENDNSLVVNLLYGNVSMLFTGDISRQSENLLDIQDVDILKVPHHGSATSSGEAFVKKTNPDFAVMLLGEDNMYGFPKPPVLRRYKDVGSIICRTDLCGDIHFKMNEKRIKRAYSFKEWNIYGGFGGFSKLKKANSGQ